MGSKGLGIKTQGRRVDTALHRRQGQMIFSRAKCAFRWWWWWWWSLSSSWASSSLYIHQFFNHLVFVQKSFFGITWSYTVFSYSSRKTLLGHLDSRSTSLRIPTFVARWATQIGHLHWNRNGNLRFPKRFVNIYLFRLQETWKWSDSNFRTEHTIQKWF